MATRLGLSARPTIVDLIGQLGLLEAMLPSFPLDHYLTLHEPTQALGDILNVISRAKDELVLPRGLRALADQMPDANDDQPRRAWRRAARTDRRTLSGSDAGVSVPMSNTVLRNRTEKISARDRRDCQGLLPACGR